MGPAPDQAGKARQSAGPEDHHQRAVRLDAATLVVQIGRPELPALLGISAG